LKSILKKPKYNKENENENKEKIEKEKGSYVQSLIKNSNNARSKKILSMVSSLGNLNELKVNKNTTTNNKNKNFLTEGNLNFLEEEFDQDNNYNNDNDNEYDKQKRLQLTKSAKNFFKDKNESKLRKFVDHSSNIFPNDLYGNNLNITQKQREIIKLKLIPSDKKANLNNLSNEELKSAFAKKGYFNCFIFLKKFFQNFFLYFFNIVFMLLI
jgi:hypothetical protein